MKEFRNKAFLFMLQTALLKAMLASDEVHPAVLEVCLTVWDAECLEMTDALWRLTNKSWKGEPWNA